MEKVDLQSRISNLTLMIKVVTPLVIFVGLIGVPFFSNGQPYWQVPTVVPASLFLTISACSFALLKFKKVNLAVRLYTYGFILAPLAAAIGSAGTTPGILGLMVGGVIIATVLLESKQAVYVSACVAVLSVIFYIFLFPEASKLDQFIVLGVIMTLIAMVLVFKSFNEKIEEKRREKLEKVNRLLTEQNYKLVKINEELDKFIYSVSHDIRAPLTSIIGLVNLYKKETELGHKDVYLDYIEKSTSQLENYIGDIVDFVRNTKTDLNPVKIEIEGYLKSIYEQLRYIDPINKIAFEVNSNGVKEIITDKERLGIILRNIISNSIKYSNKRIDSYIKCKIERNGSHHIIRIKDNGIGIEESQMSHVFNMFHRASETSDGSGLGLYIAKEAADALGGRIALTSVHGEFTELVIELPILQTQE